MKLSKLVLVCDSTGAHAEHFRRTGWVGQGRKAQNLESRYFQSFRFSVSSVVAPSAYRYGCQEEHISVPAHSCRTCDLWHDPNVEFSLKYVSAVVRRSVGSWFDRTRLLWITYDNSWTLNYSDTLWNNSYELDAFRQKNEQTRKFSRCSATHCTARHRLCVVL